MVCCPSLPFARAEIQNNKKKRSKGSVRVQRPTEKLKEEGRTSPPQKSCVGDLWLGQAIAKRRKAERGEPANKRLMEIHALVGEYIQEPGMGLKLGMKPGSKFSMGMKNKSMT
ncbi:hypothetical protein EVAR_7560_1 [Eumeta japonica]|uniref:Uncharacterized protein n=1 Tax=Eumeta variegata TaxID=151549 RepID=A0A4C1VPH0_EUMVA|nr:hypothetical protein EVAR_7560_1 [Eumeta japonica]